MRERAKRAREPRSTSIYILMKSPKVSISGLLLGLSLYTIVYNTLIIFDRI